MQNIMSKKLSIIVVSFNSGDFIEKCIISILKNISKNDEVIVLDNNSTDSTVKKLKKYLPKINLIESSENWGFSKGNNLAAKSAQGEYLFFLNPDASLTSTLGELVMFYEEHPDAGIVAPKLIMPDGKPQESVKNLPTVFGAFKEYILGIKNSYSQYVPKTDQPLEVQSAYGAALLIKKELFDRLGGFDEKFFLYYEDVDLCKRIKQVGKKIYYYPLVLVEHLVGATSSDKNRYELNLESFVKYHGKLKSFILQFIFLVPRLKRKLG